MLVAVVPGVSFLERVFLGPSVVIWQSPQVLQVHIATHYNVFCSLNKEVPMDDFERLLHKILEVVSPPFLNNKWNDRFLRN